jgi:hypothetical protein
LGNLPGFEISLPLIGKTYLGPTKVASIWEAIGFTATSNNVARQKERLKAIEKARMVRPREYLMDQELKFAANG